MSRISRRSLLTSGAAAGVLAASGMALMAAPRQGGILRAAVAGGSVSDNWDSRSFSGLFMMVAAHGAVFDCLTEVGADGALRGELAESWEASPDARIWTFNLRQGVQFHNGKAFGAEDALESMALHMAADSVSPVAPLLNSVITLQKVTDHQIQFHLDAPNPDFPYLMADHRLIIYPAGLVELAMENGIGTGLYRVESFEPGRRLLARRVSAHYKGTSAGYFDEIDLINQDSDSARIDALMQGEIDVAGQLPPRLLGQIKASPDLTIERVAGNQHYRFAIDADERSSDLAHLQQALKYGIDRTEFLKTNVHGMGQIASDTPIGPANQYFFKDIAPIDFDPDKARHHLRKSGVDRVSLSMSGYAFPDARAAGAFLSDQFERIGVTANVALDHPNGTLYLDSSFGRVTEDWVLSTFVSKNAQTNLNNWAHPGFQNLLLAARSELDSNRRRTHYQDMQQLLRDEGPISVPVFADHVFATRKTVAHAPVLGNLSPLDSARFAERWWRA